MASRHHFDRRRQCYVDDDDDDDNDAVYNKHQAYGRQRQRDDNSDGEYDSDSQRYKSVANDIPRTRVGQAYHGRQSRYQTYHDNDSETDNPQVNYHHTSYRHPRDEEDSDSEEDYGNPRAVAHHRNTPPIPGRINMFPDDRQRRSAGRNSPDGYRSLSPQYYPQNISSDGTFMSANSREPNDEPQSLNAWPWDAPDTNVNARGARSSRQQAGRFSHPHPSMTGYNRHRGGRQQRYAEDQQPQQPRRRIQQPTTYSARGRRRSHPMQQRQRQMNEIDHDNSEESRPLGQEVNDETQESESVGQKEAINDETQESEPVGQKEAINDEAQESEPVGQKEAINDETQESEPVGQKAAINDEAQESESVGHEEENAETQISDPVGQKEANVERKESESVGQKEANVETQESDSVGHEENAETQTSDPVGPKEANVETQESDSVGHEEENDETQTSDPVGQNDDGNVENQESQPIRQEKDEEERQEIHPTEEVKERKEIHSTEEKEERQTRHQILPPTAIPQPQERPRPVGATRRSRFTMNTIEFTEDRVSAQDRFRRREAQDSFRRREAQDSFEERESQDPFRTRESVDRLHNQGRSRRSNRIGTRRRSPEDWIEEGQYIDYMEDIYHEYSSLPPQYWRPNEGIPNQHGNKFDVLSPQLLIDALMKCPGFHATLLQLVESCYFHPSSVRSVVSENTHIFTMNEDVVYLKPHIGLCSNHLGPNGCQKRSSCNDIHVCPRFIAGLCSKSNCIFGHKFKTNHNIMNLNRFCLEHLTSSNLKKILKVSNTVDGTQEHLNICHNYNTSNCKQSNCDALHICVDYIVGHLVCPNQQCRRNHNLLAQDCCWLLEKHGIDTNETPRDILAILLEVNPLIGKIRDPSLDTTHDDLNPSSCDIVSNHETSNDESVHSTEEASSNDTRNISHIDTDVSNIQSSHLTEMLSDDSNVTPPMHNNANNINITNTRSEANSATSDGEKEDSNMMQSQIGSNVNNEYKTSVEVSESQSRPSINETEDNDSNIDNSTLTVTNTEVSDHTANPETIITGEPLRQSENASTTQRFSLWSHYLEGDVRLAEICYDSVKSTCKEEIIGCSRLHSSRHFHWQVSEENYSWLNLQSSQVMRLELAFCDPSIDVIELPSLNPDLANSSMSILLLLMGQETWKANFQGMVLINSDESRILYLRRLCTEIIPGLTIESSIYHWFFCDDSGEWVEYGSMSSEEEEEEQASYVNSEAIESQYMINPFSFVQFTISETDYILDFNSMTQTNLSTQDIILVRRRPKPHLPDEEEIMTSN